MSQALSDRQLVIRELELAGVRGAAEFGRFVNDTRYFEPSAFDERSAMPVLLRLLPVLTSGGVVSDVAGHLRRPWARGVAFPALLEAFRRFALFDFHAGWKLGDALASAARPTDVPPLLEVCGDRRFGKSREMVVYSLWRFKKDDRVVPLLTDLLVDEDVAGHAANALRRSIGNDLALPHLRAAGARLPQSVGLAREIKKASK